MRRRLFLPVLLCVGTTLIVPSCDGLLSDSGSSSTSVNGVSLNKSSSTIYVGGSETLIATVSPSDADNQAVSWSSDDTSIATVSSSGLVSGVAAGVASITVTTADGSYTASCSITVKAVSVSVTGVTLNKSSTSIYVGGSETLTATIAPSNASNQTVSWSSDDTSIATVSSSGLVSGVSAGSTTITATTVDGGYSASCSVTIAPIAVTGVTLNKSSTSIYVGGSEALTATFAPSDATNQAVSWSSSAASIATVSGSGLVSGVSAGSATITVTTADGGYTASCSVSVMPIAVTGVTLNKSTTTIDIGDSETLVATIAPTNATNQAVSWFSSDSTIATVSDSGLVSGVAAGSATITVTTTDGSYTAFCSVIVPQPVTGVSLNKSITTIYVGGSETLIATIAPTDATNQTISWSSVDTSIATISSSGLVSGVAAGSTTIIATTEDGSYTASCVVTVETVSDSGTITVNVD